jgi:hypothetical protein
MAVDLTENQDVIWNSRRGYKVSNAEMEFRWESCERHERMLRRDGKSRRPTFHSRNLVRSQGRFW